LPYLQSVTVKRMNT